MAKPEDIKKFERLKKKGRKIIDTTDLHHAAAFTHAADEVIREEETGLIDYDLLKQTKYQTKFAKTMSDYYVDKAEKIFKIRVKERDEVEKALLMRAYAGVTEAELKEYLRESRDKFTLDVFERQIKPRFMKRIGETLKGVAGQHFKDEHIDDIVKYMGIGHLVNTKYMQLADAIELLHTHTELGVLPEKELEDKLYYKKRKKE